MCQKLAVVMCDHMPIEDMPAGQHYMQSQRCAIRLFSAVYLTVLKTRKLSLPAHRSLPLT